VRDLSPIMIAANEERKRKKFDGQKIADALKAYNVPAMPSIHQPIDILWYVDGQCVAADCKTVEDFIASYQDGRLHDQITAMQNMQCKFFFLLIEGDPWSEDGGFNVGGSHGWTWDAFDDAIFDVQVYGGVQIVRSPSKEQTPRRLAALWRWTGKDEAASWHSPVPLIPSSDYSPGGVTFFDKGYRTLSACSCTQRVGAQGLMD